jgi:hypothetical protein
MTGARVCLFPLIEYIQYIEYIEYIKIKKIFIIFLTRKQQSGLTKSPYLIFTFYFFKA